MIFPMKAFYASSSRTIFETIFKERCLSKTIEIIIKEKIIKTSQAFSLSRWLNIE